MPRLRWLVGVIIAGSVPILGQSPPAGVTVFEGARVIVGDGRAH